VTYLDVRYHERLWFPGGYYFDVPNGATAIYIGDIGTKGGLVTDADARVLDTAGQPIEGLYAAGNTTASVTGRSYPGPGVTLGPAMTFGYIAAQHIARRVSNA
jgi:3-oxosteroid 1-dehydrogenase